MKIALFLSLIALSTTCHVLMAEDSHHASTQIAQVERSVSPTVDGMSVPVDEWLNDPECGEFAVVKAKQSPGEYFLFHRSNDRKNVDTEFEFAAPSATYTKSQLIQNASHDQSGKMTHVTPVYMPHDLYTQIKKSDGTYCVVNLSVKNEQKNSSRY